MYDTGTQNQQNQIDTTEWGGKRLVRVAISTLGYRCVHCELYRAPNSDCSTFSCAEDEAPYFTDAVYRTAQDAATYRLTGEFPELDHDTP